MELEAGEQSLDETTVETNKPAPVTLLTADEISNGISNLKKVVSWPTEDKQIIPLYDDESATIYLHFATKDIKGINPIGRVNLPNPLSYKRSVCWIARGVEDVADVTKLKALLTEVGVSGKIKILPVDEIKATLAAKNSGKVYKLASFYDTFLAEKKVLGDIAVHSLYFQMSKQGKHVNLITPKKSQDMKKTLEEGLAKSNVMPNKSMDAYVWKVGHTGMTDAQVHANVTAALRALATWTASFPDGLSHFTVVRLRTGDTDGVALYTNPGDVAVALPYKRHEDQEMYTKADDQLYWMNRLQEEDGKSYWKTNDKKLRNIIKNTVDGKTSNTRKNTAAVRLNQLQALKEKRFNESDRTGKRPAPWNSGAPGSGKKSRTANSPHKAGTPGSGKKQKKQGTPVSANQRTPLKSMNAPGSGKKQTPQKAGTPGSEKKQTPLKANTPVSAKELTPGSAKAQGAATPGFLNTPGSDGKKKRNRKSKIGGTGTPAGTPQAGAGNGTPGSSGKKMKMRLRQRTSVGFSN